MLMRQLLLVHASACDDSRRAFFFLSASACIDSLIFFRAYLAVE